MEVISEHNEFHKVIQPYAVICITIGPSDFFVKLKAVRLAQSPVNYWHQRCVDMPGSTGGSPAVGVEARDHKHQPILLAGKC